MYTLTDQLLVQALAIHQGRHTLSSTHQEIISWISQQFQVRALDFCFEKREKHTSNQLVHIILEKAEDVKKLQPNHAAITERFIHYLKNTPNISASDLLKNNVFPPDTNPFPEVIITYRPLVIPDKDTLQKMRDDERSLILKTFENVWTISQNVIFYYTEEQVKENQKIGVSAKIIEALEALDKKYNVIQNYTYTFDSKESFDRDYEGKWHYYWK